MIWWVTDVVNVNIIIIIIKSHNMSVWWEVAAWALVLRSQVHNLTHFGALHFAALLSEENWLFNISQVYIEIYKPYYRFKLLVLVNLFLRERVFFFFCCYYSIFIHVYFYFIYFILFYSTFAVVAIIYVVILIPIKYFKSNHEHVVVKTR